MDPDVLRMMADLGAHRRDIVSAPEERDGGRRGGGDWRQEMRAMEEATEHRKKACSGPENNERAKMLKMWNTEDTFGSDAIADSLENRMDGQGHRARLREQLQAQQARFDDNPRPHRNYRHDANDLSAPPPGRGRPSELDRTPRNFNFAAPPPSTAPVLDPNRTRAPSPRAAGRVRFVNGQRVTSSTASAAAPPTMPAAMRPSGMPQPAQTLRPSPQPVPTSQPAPAVSAPSRPVDAPQPARSRATAMAPTATSSPRPRMAVAAAPAAVASPLPTDPTSYSRFILATGYVETPTERYEKYYREHPNEAPYVDQARKHLAMAAVKCVRNGNKEAYTKLHPARKWLVDIAETALTGGDPESGNVLAWSTVDAIVSAATEQRQKDNQVTKESAAEASAPGTPALPHAAPAPTAPKPPVTLVPAAPAPIASTSVPTSHPRPSSTLPTLKDLVKECVDLAVNKVIGSSRAEGSKTAASSVVAADGTPSRRDSVMAVNSPAPGGMLTAMYLDASGKLVQQSQIHVNAPVMANVIITSTRHHYHPRQLAQAMQALAQQMADRSMGTFRRGDDGIWDDAKALDFGLMD